VVDDAMSMDIITTLQHIFRSTSPYWIEHNYDIVLSASSTAGYYSYLYPMKAQSYQPKYFIEQVKYTSYCRILSVYIGNDMPIFMIQVINQIFEMVCEYYPAAKESNYGK